MPMGQFKNPKERAEKISKALKGKRCSPFSGFKKGHKGFRTKESYQGIKFSEEAKQNLRKIRNGQTIKGGKYKSKQGYIHIYSPYHPYCSKLRYVKRANLVMEKHLRRFLKPEEIVHHINSIRDDDRIENLQLFPNINSHTQFHSRLYVRKTKTPNKKQ